MPPLEKSNNIIKIPDMADVIPPNIRSAINVNDLDRFRNLKVAAVISEFAIALFYIDA
jgi:hypothetical protein